MKIAVVKYNAGNIYSVDYALKRLGVEATITSDKEVLMSADKVIFPGVGEAETTMSHLRTPTFRSPIGVTLPVLGSITSLPSFMILLRLTLAVKLLSHEKRFHVFL